MSDNLLIIAASETDSNLYYASRFLAPDAFIYLAIQGRSYLLMSDLEVDRARAQSQVDEVLSYADLRERTKARGVQKPHERAIKSGSIIRESWPRVRPFFIANSVVRSRQNGSASVPIATVGTA